MKGAILDKGENHYTNMLDVFSALNCVQKKYNWLITDCECYPSSQKSDSLLSGEYCWLSGEALTAMVEADHFQWIWAVLSGFDQSIPLKEVLRYPLPYGDGYRGFWKNPVSIQHPLASVEIVAWDSTLTLVIGKDDGMVSDFRRAFPLSQDLCAYNERQA